ncbi:MAG: DMT family transporter [Saprospiraceae bacterium]|nr:DMT family transporter [Saprospiraceae bacterium]
MNFKKKILRWNDWIAFALLSFIWGTSFILIKKSLVAFDSMQVASLRILIATLAFTPVFIFNLKKINFRIWYKYLIVGLAGGGIPPFLFSLAQTKVSSSLAGALNTLTPIFTLILAVIIFRNKIDLKKSLGVAIGLVGAFIMIYSTNSEFTGGVFYSSLIVLAAILYGFNVNLVKKFFNDHDPTVLTAASFMFFGPFSIIILLNGDFFEVMRTDSSALFSLASVTLLSLFSTVLATVLFFRLVQRSNALFASSVSFMAPFVALIWGLLDGETFNFIYILSLILILTGVYLTRNNNKS